MEQQVALHSRWRSWERERETQSQRSIKTNRPLHPCKLCLWRVYLKLHSKEGEMMMLFHQKGLNDTWTLARSPGRWNDHPLWCELPSIRCLASEKVAPVQWLSQRPFLDDHSDQPAAHVYSIAFSNSLREQVSSPSAWFHDFMIPWFFMTLLVRESVSWWVGQWQLSLFFPCSCLTGPLFFFRAGHREALTLLTTLTPLILAILLTTHQLMKSHSLNGHKDHEKK